MKNLISLVILGLILVSCGPEKPKTEGESQEHPSGKDAVIENVDEGKGVGQVKEVTLNTPLEQERIPRGKAIYEMKCQACHRLDDQRVVGPGWKDVTKKRKPEWIMNMITNVDVMLDKDAEAQKLLELCLTRMPNQNVSLGDARDVLEFMRQNDGEK
ncbi:c-type cytochrome [Chryseolinea sp. H1M3-3]|uniref:c-type cytochrome n=1 Tax=Chryseolinea sp. H1M3-3 TaxID=3034144 RepID=UPI0023EBA083|nr:c-type cytochrome [Chryseolinea sp. H1M3-3]